MSEFCPLCASREISFYHRDKRRDYLECHQCALVFVPRRFYLSEDDEKAEYDRHDNAVDDPGYRRFLSRIFNPMCERVEAGACGLDFGSGPGPALAAMFREAGFDMALYDIFYAPDESVLQRRYDFVTATEVVEHLHRPREVISDLWDCLNPGGYLGLMTKRVIDREAFAHWHYKNDPTHVCFFSTASLHWLAARLGGVLEIVGKDVAILHKPSSPDV